jgi:hypothetical protein
MIATMNNHGEPWIIIKMPPPMAAPNRRKTKVAKASFIGHILTVAVLPANKKPSDDSHPAGLNFFLVWFYKDAAPTALEDLRWFG